MQLVDVKAHLFKDVREKLSWVAVEQWFLALLLFVLAIGPWTRGLAILFAFGEFERQSVIEMTWYLLRKTPVSLWYGAPYFVVVPFVLISVRVWFPRIGAWIRAVLQFVGIGLSLALLPMMFLPTDRLVTNPMAQVIAADLFAMWMWHAILCLIGDLPPWTLVCGPLFGLVFHLTQVNPRRNSIIGGIGVLYLHIGVLYRGHADLEAMGHALLTNTISLVEWGGYEFYGLVTVVWSFLVISVSVPVPQTCAELLETILYIILLNANVAAAWIASMGVFRRRLE